MEGIVLHGLEEPNGGSGFYSTLWVLGLGGLGYQSVWPFSVGMCLGFRV